MKKLELPAWALWMAMDEDGCWWCYEAEPHQHDHGWYENEVGESCKINYFPESPTDWRQSLLKVSDIYS